MEPNYTRPYDGPRFDSLQPEREALDTVHAPPLGFGPVTSPRDLLKVMLDLRNELARQGEAWRKHWAEEDKRRSAWAHSFAFRLVANEQRSLTQVTGLDVRWIKIVTAQTTAEDGILYAKMAASFNIDVVDQFPYAGDWDYVMRIGEDSPAMPCRDAQAFSLYTTAPVDGVCYFAGSKEAIPN